jgi:hypothetical protein
MRRFKTGQLCWAALLPSLLLALALLQPAEALGDGECSKPSLHWRSMVWHQGMAKDAHASLTCMCACMHEYLPVQIRVERQPAKHDMQLVAPPPADGGS